jgi:type II secretory pathway component PulF
MDFTFDEYKSIQDRVVMGFKRWQFGTKAQLGFLEDLYTLINDGIPANRAVEMMAQVTTGLTHEVALSLADTISQGQPLAEGMKKWFNPNVVEIVRVGESGGALAQTLKSAINMLAQQGVAIGAFISAVSYPLLVITIACVIIIYLNNQVFEQFRSIKPIEQWPDEGKRLVSIAILIQHWWWAFILGVILFVISMRWVLKNYIGEMRSELDKFPPFSLYRRLVAARLLETMGLLVSNGVVFKSAIKVMQYQSTPYMNYHLVMMEHLLSTGKTNIGEVLDTGLVESRDLMRLKVMAEVKGFEHGLIRMGIRGTEEATATMKAISRMVGGLLLMVGAGLIIVIVQGIYLTGMAMGS